MSDEYYNDMVKNHETNSHRKNGDVALTTCQRQASCEK